MQILFLKNGLSPYYHLSYQPMCCRKNTIDIYRQIGRIFLWSFGHYEMPWRYGKQRHGIVVARVYGEREREGETGRELDWRERGSKPFSNYNYTKKWAFITKIYIPLQFLKILGVKIVIKNVYLAFLVGWYSIEGVVHDSVWEERERSRGWEWEREFVATAWEKGWVAVKTKD